MNTYRIADMRIAFKPQTAFTADFLAAYQTDDAAQLTVTLPPALLQAEAAHLPHAPIHLLETTALLRHLSTQFLDHQRLMLHAATVVADNAAYTFMAPSGTGKTTHARLWQEQFRDRVFILNGDRLFVHIQPNGATAFGGPWRGKEGIGRNTSAPLRGLFILTRSDRAYCEPLSPTEALPHLLRATPYPTAQQDRLKVLTLLEQLTERVPLFHLHASLSLATVDAAVAQLGGLS